LEWQKEQELAARRRRAHAGFACVYAALPSEGWCALTPQRAQHLLHAHWRIYVQGMHDYDATLPAKQRAVAQAASDAERAASSPTQWESSTFYMHALTTHCKWRAEEVRRERVAIFNAALVRVMRDLRAEATSSTVPMALTKNDLTRRLTGELGHMPSREEVEEAWSDGGQAFLHVARLCRRGMHAC
jgi:hypothetical protein